jgi:hypothetical protein
MRLESVLAEGPELPIVLPHHGVEIRQLTTVDARDIERRVVALGERTCGCVPHEVFPDARCWTDFDREALAADPEAAADGARQVRKWLFECGVPFGREVFVGSYEGEVVATTWKLFVRYWQRFRWPEWGEVYVTDRSVAWMLGCCHHHILSFGARPGSLTSAARRSRAP